MLEVILGGEAGRLEDLENTVGSCLLKEWLILLAAEDMRRQSARILPRGDRKHRAGPLEL